MGPVAWQLRTRGAGRSRRLASRQESLSHFSPNTTNHIAVVCRIFDAAADQTKRPFERLMIPCKGPHLLLLCLAGSLTHVDPAAHLRWEAENIFSSELGATTSAW